MNNLQAEAMRTIRDRLLPLHRYFEDDAVNEIMINAADNIFVEARGAMDRIDIRLKDFAVEAAINAVMTVNSKDSGYIMDARLPGMRVACALPPVSIHGPMMVLRKHARKRYSLQDYEDSGALTRRSRSTRNNLMDDAVAMEKAAANGGAGLREFLRWAVLAKKNVLVVGGTGSGKTTLLAACMMEIPLTDRIVTCESPNEITLDQPNILQLETFEVPGSTPIIMSDLIKLCMRSRPDRIVVGELRGGEALDFVDAMNTGHPGSLCTVHADSAFLGLSRMEALIRRAPAASNMLLKDIRGDIAKAIQYVMFLRRGDDGSRGPEEVIALDGVDENGNYQWREIFNKYF